MPLLRTGGERLAEGGAGMFGTCWMGRPGQKWLDVVPLGDSLCFFYEPARPDGSQLVRASVVELPRA